MEAPPENLAQITCSLRVGVVGPSLSGKKTLLRTLEVLPQDRDFQMTPTNEEIHSSNNNQTSAGYTPLPFVGAASTASSQDLRYPVLTPRLIDDWDLEAEPFWIHRNLTSHHFKSVLGISEPGLSVLAYSSAYDAEEWTFVAPLVCTSSDVIVFVVNNTELLHNAVDSSLIQAIDLLVSCRRKVIFVVNQMEGNGDGEAQETRKALYDRYGENILVHSFDVRSDGNNLLKLKSSILLALLDEMKRLKRVREVSMSVAAVDFEARQMLQQYSQKVDDEVLSAIKSLVAHVMSTEEHLRVFLGHSSPEELMQRLSAYLHLRLLGHLYKILSMRLLQWMSELDGKLLPGIIRDSLLTFTPSDFESLLSPLYAWVSHQVAPQATSAAYIGAVSTATGAAAALGILALSWTGAAVVAATSVAALLGASAGYAAPPIGTVLSVPGKKQIPPSEEALRDSVVSELASRFSNLNSHHYTELRSLILLSLRKVFLSAQLTRPAAATHEWFDLATIDENYLDVTLSRKNSTLSASNPLNARNDS